MKRRVRVAKSAREHVRMLLDQGIEKFGVDIADEKRVLVVRAIEKTLAEYPLRGLKNPQRKLQH